MYEVVVSGWKGGRSILPISFANVVRAHLGVSLAESKRALDEFANVGSTVLAFGDEEGARAFATAVTELGAQVQVRSLVPK